MSMISQRTILIHVYVAIKKTSFVEVAIQSIRIFMLYHSSQNQITRNEHLYTRINTTYYLSFSIDGTDKT